MDLHLHSLYSDGFLSPEQLISEALANQVKTISITDHDTVEGYHKGLNYAHAVGLRLIPGIEFNTENSEGELHILGYQFNTQNKNILQHVNWRKEQALNWGKRLVKSIQRSYPIAWACFAERCQGGIINRTHIAYALMGKGFFTDFKRAYRVVLEEEKKVFRLQEPFSARQAIDLIHTAGGEAYLAHPQIYNFKPNLDKLKKWGLDGLEVYYPRNTREETAYWLKEARRLELKLSGGSDYHGPDSKSSFPVGSVKLPAEVYAQWEEPRQEQVV